MIKQFIILSTILSLWFGVKCQQPMIPLNFRDVISHLNIQLRQEPIHKSNYYKILVYSHNFFQSSLENILYENVLNISMDCSDQLEQLLTGLKNKKEWSFRVLDSFGKIPSGLMNGNIAWLGEFSECKNISANEGNWTGKYGILSKPLKTYDPQDSIQNSGLKYGICVPNKCSQNDISQIIDQSKFIFF